MTLQPYSDHTKGSSCIILCHSWKKVGKQNVSILVGKLSILLFACIAHRDINNNVWKSTFSCNSSVACMTAISRLNFKCNEHRFLDTYAWTLVTTRTASCIRSTSFVPECCTLVNVPRPENVVAHMFAQEGTAKPSFIPSSQQQWITSTMYSSLTPWSGRIEGKAPLQCSPPPLPKPTSTEN